MAAIEQGVQRTSSSRAEELLDSVIEVPDQLEAIISPLQEQMAGVGKLYNAVTNDPDYDPATRARKQEEVKNYEHAVRARIKKERSEYGSLLDENTSAMIRELRDPHSDAHPIIRTVLLAPHIESEKPLSDPNVLTAARDLGQQFFDLHKHLESVTAEQPFVIVTYKPRLNSGWYEDIQLSYGSIAPGVGLTPKKGEIIDEICDCCGGYHHMITPGLKLPIITSASVMPSVRQHEYFTSYRTLVNVNGTKEETELPRLATFFNRPKDSIILPTGGMFIDGASPIVRYDSEEGIAEIRAGSRANAMFGEKSFCAIGTQSVGDTIDAILTGSRGAYSPEGVAKSSKPERQLDVYELLDPTSDFNGSDVDKKRFEMNGHMCDMFTDVTELVRRGVRRSKQDR